MESVLNVIGWLEDNWEVIAVILTGIAALTPTEHDNSVVDRIVNLGRKVKEILPIKRKV